MECKRTLKPGGMLFSVFPSYYEPIDGAHLSLVTRMPCLQWLFDTKTLNNAYSEIMASRGEEAYWYRTNKKDWQTLHGGIGINGTTFNEFRSIVREVGFSKEYILPNPLLSVRIILPSYSKTKYISKTLQSFFKIGSAILKPLLRIESLEDYLSYRIVSVLVS